MVGIELSNIHIDLDWAGLRGLKALETAQKMLLGEEAPLQAEAVRPRIDRLRQYLAGAEMNPLCRKRSNSM